MRADSFFAEKFGSRTRAKAALERGVVLRNGKPLAPKDDVTSYDGILFLEEDAVYASRGGYKLARGLDAFGVRVAGEVFADLGASTGGFCDVLLQRGARRVFAVDVGESLLDRRLAQDARVTVMDRTNARFLRREQFDEPLHGIVSDLSFISLKLVLPAAATLLQDGGRVFALFKPQFECEGVGLGKSGILPVRYHAALLDAFFEFCLTIGLAPQDVINAPVKERKNVEYIVFLQKGGTPCAKGEFLRKAAQLK